MIEIKDASKVDFEKKQYDTILLDPPYMPETEFNRKFAQNIYSDKDNKKWNFKNIEITLFTDDIYKIIERVKKYAQTNQCWMVLFSNKPLNYEMRINWMREKGGLGTHIRRNTEYIHFYNYHKLKPVGWIEETVYIPKDWQRAFSKPVKLYEQIYFFLGSKKILDLFAGFGNSVVASYLMDLEIDAYDIDPKLSERYAQLRKMAKTKQLKLTGGKKNGQT